MENKARVWCESDKQCGLKTEVEQRAGGASVTSDSGNYFSGENTGALLVAGKALGNDGPLFLNDVSAIKERLLLLGIRPENIFQVIPGDRVRQRRNIIRAIEDLKDLNIKHFILFFAGHCNNNHKFLLTGFHTDVELSDQEIKNFLRKLPVRKMLIILDCCFSGGTDMGVRGGEGCEGEGLMTDGEGEDAEEGACGGTMLNGPVLWDLWDFSSDGTSGCQGNDDGNGGNGDSGHETNLVCEKDRHGESGNGGGRNGGSGNDDGEETHGRSDNGESTNVGSGSRSGGGGTRGNGNGNVARHDNDGDGSHGNDVGASHDNSERQVVQWCSSQSGEESFNYTQSHNGVFTNGILTIVDALNPGTDVSVLEMHNRVKAVIRKRQEPVLQPHQACDSSTDFSRRFPRFHKL